MYLSLLKLFTGLYTVPPCFSAQDETEGEESPEGAASRGELRSAAIGSFLNYDTESRS